MIRWKQIWGLMVLLATAGAAVSIHAAEFASLVSAAKKEAAEGVFFRIDHAAESGQNVRGLVDILRGNLTLALNTNGKRTQTRLLRPRYCGSSSRKADTRCDQRFTHEHDCAGQGWAFRSL